MKVTRLVGLGTLCVSAGIGAWACTDEEATNPLLAPDGGPIGTTDSSTTGDTGIPPFDAALDAPLDAALWCGSGAVDGGAKSRCSTYQWDDFAATDAGADADLGTANCKACPGRALTCADLVRRVDGGSSQVVSPTYDHYVTKTLSVDVTAHAGEIVGGAVTVTHATCYGSPYSDASVFTVPVQVHGNNIRAPLAANLADGGTYDSPCGVITYQLVDSCCTPSTVKFETYFDPEFGLYKTSCPDGG
jgi:hypothetical protein